MEVGLPASVIGLGIAEPLHLSMAVDGKLVYITEMTKIYSMLTVCVFIQLFFIAHLYKVDEHGMDSECAPHLVGLCLVCVFVFEATILAELRHSFLLFGLIYHAEPDQGKGPVPQAGAVMVAEEEKGGALNRMTRKFRQPVPPEMPQWNMHQASKTYKTMCSIFVVIPKIFIGMWLGYAGGIYIAQCQTTEDMILNTLAVNFVVDIDEILYDSFTSDATKASLENAETVEITLGNRGRIALWAFNTVVFPLLAVFLAYLFVHVIKGCHHAVWGEVFSTILCLFIPGSGSEA